MCFVLNDSCQEEDFYIITSSNDLIFVTYMFRWGVPNLGLVSNHHLVDHDSLESPGLRMTDALEEMNLSAPSSDEKNDVGSHRFWIRWHGGSSYG